MSSDMEVCNRCHEAKPDVRYRQNPYDADVNNDPDSYEFLCDECTQNLADDI